MTKPHGSTLYLSQQDMEAMISDYEYVADRIGGKEYKALMGEETDKE